MTVLAIFSALTHRSTELYRNLFPIPCLLCGLPSQLAPLCAACMRDLPLLGPACQCCAMPLKSAQICGQCLKSAPVQNQSFCLYRYQGPIKRCITAFKYQQQLQFSQFFSHQMATALSKRNDLPDTLIPIPLHPSRLRQRGFNQSLEVARGLASALNMDCAPRLLRRAKKTHSQSQLSFKERKRNIRGAFVCDQAQVPRHIALLDDVMTSGHTTAEAARILRQNGAEIIEVWTIARAISHY